MPDVITKCNSIIICFWPVKFPNATWQCLQNVSTLNPDWICKCISVKLLYISLCPIGINSFVQGVVGGDVTMACPIQTSNDTKIGEWSWYKYNDPVRQKVVVMEANNSDLGQNVIFLNQPRVIGTTSQDSILTLRGLKLNSAGVYECQLHARNRTELGFIKLAVNGRFRLRMTNHRTEFLSKF